MRTLTHETRIAVQRVRDRYSATRCAAVLLGAFLLSWPAIYNGFPLLYPDSMAYLGNGRLVARALFLHRFSADYGPRSLVYSLGTLPWSWYKNPWPIVGLQCLLVAWIVWLVVRSFVPRHIVTSYLALIVFLSVLTSASWYAGFIMPDILGPVLYLSIYLIVYARETLSRGERLALYLIAWWSITAHATHLLLAIGLCFLLALLAALNRRRSPGRLRPVGEVAAILAVAAASQMALNGYLYGTPSLNGRHAPILMARVIADGPGRWYLEKNCPQLQWAVCEHLRSLSSDPNTFLWGTDAPYESASESEKQRFEAEEIPLVLAALRAYPRQQFSLSAANFLDQLRYFGMFAFNYNERILERLDEVMPSERASYLKSRQERDALHLVLLTHIELWIIVASLLAIAVLILPAWRRHSRRLAGLSIVIAAMVVANAWVTGVLSGFNHRYQCRVIWMIPLLAGIFVLDWLEQRRTGKSDLALPANEREYNCAIQPTP
ncbi:MAG: hypothetical protein ABSC76_08485 [Terracidiphilus sp.]|jgi:hypothetical protein